MDNQLNKLASNMSIQIGNLNLELAQAQAENQQLKERNAQLQQTIDKLRKKETNEPSTNNLANKQIGKHSK